MFHRMLKNLQYLGSGENNLVSIPPEIGQSLFGQYLLQCTPFISPSLNSPLLFIAQIFWEQNLFFIAIYFGLWPSRLIALSFHRTKHGLLSGVLCTAFYCWKKKKGVDMMYMVKEEVCQVFKFCRHLC